MPASAPSTSPPPPPAACSPPPISTASTRSPPFPPCPASKSPTSPCWPRQSPPCRRADRRLRRRHPRRGRRPCRRRRPSTSTNCRPSSTCWKPRRPGAPLVHEHWRDNVFLETVVEDDLDRHPRHRPNQSPTQLPHRAAMHVAAGRPRRRRHLGPPPGTAAALHLHAAAAHHPHRPGRMPRPRRGPRPHRRTRCRRRLRLQGHPARRGSRRRLRSPAASTIPCAGSRTAANSSPATPTAASTTTRSPPTPTPMAACWRSTPKPPSMPAPTPPIPSPPASKPRRSPHPARPLHDGRLSLPNLVGGHQQAADPALSRRRPRRRLFRHGTDARRHRPRSKTRTARGPAAQPRAARKNALRQHHQKAFRQRRLSRMPAPRRRRDRPPRHPRRARRRKPARSALGVGLSIFCEQGAHGTSVYAGWGIPMVPGFEQAVARMTPDGGLELRVGIQSHGQGLETTLAQVAHEVLGMPLEKIMVVHGDTALTPYSTGTWGSRCAVMAGGAVATACRDLATRIGAIGAHLLQERTDSIRVGNGIVASATGSITIEEVARTWYRRPQDLPASVNPAASKSPPATSRSATPAPSATPPTPPSCRWTPSSEKSASSTTPSSKTAARCSTR